jgi:hypothetical protein
MKRLSILLAVLAMSCVTMMAQTDTTKKPDPMQTLIGTNEFTSGGFGGPVIKVASIDGQTGVLFGGRGGWVINRTFVLGGGGYGYTDNMWHLYDNGPTKDTGVTFGYGGLELEYLINSNSIVHGVVQTHIGAGGFAVIEREQDSQGNTYDWDGRTLYSVATFVFEPSVNVEVNILSWLRLGVGAGYRFVTGIDATIGGKRYDNSTVSGFFGQGIIKFGPY